MMMAAGCHMGSMSCLEHSDQFIGAPVGTSTQDSTDRAAQEPQLPITEYTLDGHRAW